MSSSCSNTLSAKYPNDEEWQDFNPYRDTPKKGIWNVMPVYQGDHMDVVGMSPQAFVFRRKYRKNYKKYLNLLLGLK